MRIIRNGPCAGHTVWEPCVECWNLKGRLKSRRTVVGPIRLQGEFRNDIPDDDEFLDDERDKNVTLWSITRSQNANPRASRARIWTWYWDFQTYGLWFLSAYEFLLLYLFFSIFLGFDIWIIANPRIGFAQRVGWHGFQMHAVHALVSIGSTCMAWVSRMNAFWTIHIESLSGCLFRGIHFTATGPQKLSALLFEFRVAICFFLQFVSFQSSRFCTAVGFCPFPRSWFHFTLLGRHSSLYYSFASSTMYVWPSIFSPTRLKDVGRLCHLSPLPWLLSVELFWSFYICFSFSYRCLSLRYQISAYTYIRRLFDHYFCYSVIAACYSAFRWDLVSLSAFWWNSMMRIIPSIPPWLCRSTWSDLISDLVRSGLGH